MTIERPIALVVEQDAMTREFLVAQLRADGFDPLPAAAADYGLVLAGRHRPDVAVVGVNGGSGRDFAKLVRSGESDADRRLPMVLLGGERHEIDTLRAFDAGADDYLSKPFSYPELHARVRALLRRVELDGPAARTSLRVGPLSMNSTTRAVLVDGRSVELTRREFSLLWTLASEPGRAFAKRELLLAIGVKRGAGSTRTLDSHACRLRIKLGRDEGWIHALWGHGFRLHQTIGVESEVVV